MKKLFVFGLIALIGCAHGSQDTIGDTTEAPATTPPDTSKCGISCGTNDAGANCGNCSQFPGTSCNLGQCEYNICAKHKNPVACNMMLNSMCFQAGQLEEYNYHCEDKSIIDDNYCQLWSIPDNGLPSLEVGYFWCCLPKTTTYLVSDPGCGDSAWPSNGGQPGPHNPPPHQQ